MKRSGSENLIYLSNSTNKVLASCKSLKVIRISSIHNTSIDSNRSVDEDDLPSAP